MIIAHHNSLRDSRPSPENIVLFKTSDPTAPAQILDLIAEPGANDAGLDIRFTAVGDDGQDGRAAYYEVVVITEAEYNASGGPELGSIGLRFSDPEPPRIRITREPHTHRAEPRDHLRGIYPCGR